MFKIHDIFDEFVLFLYVKFSFVNKYFSEKFMKKLNMDLFQAKINLTSTEYVPFCVGFSLSLSLTTFVSFFFIPQYAIYVLILTFCLSFLIFIRYPKLKKKKIARKIEDEFSFALRSFGVELNMNAPFETCIQSIANGNYKFLSYEFRKIMFDIENGSSIPEAFESFSKRIDSNFVKRGVSVLITTYQKGGRNGDLLKKLADEQNAIIKSKIKEYNGKLIIFSLIFIAASAIMPAMFQAFVIVGSSFLSITVTPAMAFWIPVLIFPLINITLFAWIRSRRP